jgi:transcriptional regulator with XRE-family HTH domain
LLTRSPSPFGRWLRQARIEARLSQAALGKLAQLHRLQIAYLESGRTALPRADARGRLFAALGKHPPPAAVADSTCAARRDTPCAFCGAGEDASWFMATSSIKPGIGICAYCLLSANQQATAAAREHADDSQDVLMSGEGLGDW